KVTDRLIALRRNKVTGLDTNEAINQIIERFESIINELGLSESLLSTYRKTLDHYLDTIEDENRLLDALKSCGEDFNAQLLSDYLNRSGVPARYVSPKAAGIKVTDEPSNAQLLPESYDALSKLNYEDHVLVVPGFFGVSENDRVVAFPRGGSDITGAIVARGTDADLYENFTDVSHIYSAHPGM